MISRCLKRVINVIVRHGANHFSTSLQRSHKVTVIGAAGGIGQPLTLLLKTDPLVTRLSVYDIAPITPGIALDVSHVNTPTKVTSHKPERLREALRGSDVVVLGACLGASLFHDEPSVAKSKDAYENLLEKKPPKPTVTREDLFKMNASLIRHLTMAIGRMCPYAMLTIITNPLNSIIPLAAEVLTKMGVFDKNRLFGVTTLDVIRSSVFVGKINDVDPSKVIVPVIGGHAGVTIIPVLSQSEPPVELNEDETKKLIQRIQEAGYEVLDAKAGEGSATLSMAYATARFVNSLLRGLEGEKNVIECAYVSSEVTDAPFFATPLLLGRDGIERNLGLGFLNSYEESLVKAAIPILEKDIQLGINFVNIKGVKME